MVSLFRIIEIYDCRNRLVFAGGVTHSYDAKDNSIAMESEQYKEDENSILELEQRLEIIVIKLNEMEKD